MDLSKHLEPWPALGLAYRDAIARLASPRLLESASLPVKTVVVRVPQRSNWVSPYRDDGIGGYSRRIDLNKSERDDANSKAMLAFYGALSTGAMVALGHEDESAALKLERQGQPAPAISPKEWAVLRIVGASGSKAKQGKIEVYHGLRFLPLLHSSLAAEAVAGLTLQEAFSRYVAGDPELIAVCEAEDLDPLPVASSEVTGNSVAHAVAGQRKQALLGLLKSGALVAHGVDARGRAMALEPSRWGAERIAVDWSSDLQLRLPDAVPRVATEGLGTGWKLEKNEVAKSFVARFFDGRKLEDVEAELAAAGGLDKFAAQVSANSGGSLSSSAIRKALSQRLKDSSGARSGVTSMKLRQKP